MTRPELTAQKSTPVVELPTTPAPASEVPQTPTPDGPPLVVIGATPRTDLKKLVVALTGRFGVAPEVMEPSISRRPAAFAAVGAATLGFRMVEALASFALPRIKLPPVAAAAGRDWSAVTPTAPAAPAAAIPAIRSSSRRLWRSLPLPFPLPPWPFEFFASSAASRSR